MKPQVTVIMSVYNGERHLRAAIEGVLGQSFRNFEFIIIDDGSTDASQQIIESYDDPRIRLLPQENRGLVAALNRGIKEAKGDLIARQDADDVSLPDRLRLQAEYMDQHPGCVIVGTGIDIVDDADKVLGHSPLLTNDAEIRMEMLVRSPFAHGSVMMRAAAIATAGGYRQEFWPAEDYDLWLRLLRLGQGANVDQILYHYRDSVSGISNSKRQEQMRQHRRIQAAVWHDRQFNSQLESLDELLESYDTATTSGRIQASRLANNYLAVLRGAIWRVRPLVAARLIIGLLTSRQAWRKIRKRMAN